LLRFDMDALPIVEETGAEYASQTQGVMHACEHDGHTAIGLTVAKILHAHRAQLAGSIKFCFQPSEEGTNGEEVGGAEMMMRDGLLEAPKVDNMLALHLWNEEPLGWLGIASGPMMAGADLFTVKVIGRGGHGDIPHVAVDPVIAAAQIVTALQTIVSRNVAPLDTAVVSVTSIHAGTTFNVIPPEATLEGTIRTFERGTRQKVHERFGQIVRGTAEALGCQAEITIKRVTPPLVNDATISTRLQETARRLLPNADLRMTGYLTMGAEDAAFLLEKVNGCFFFVGSANKERNLHYGHHHPKFDFDEEALVHSTALMAAAAIDLLQAQ
jgi:amidohydrolase